MTEPLGAGLPETGDRHGAFPRLTDEQLEMLRAAGTERKVEPGEILFREGDAHYDFFAVEEGSVTIVADYACETPRVIAVHGARRFTGELNLLTGTGVYLTAVVREPGTVIEVSADKLRDLVAQDEEL